MVYIYMLHVRVGRKCYIILTLVGIYVTICSILHVSVTVLLAMCEQIVT